MQIEFPSQKKQGQLCGSSRIDSRNHWEAAVKGQREGKKQTLKRSLNYKDAVNEGKVSQKSVCCKPQSQEEARPPAAGPPATTAPSLRNGRDVFHRLFSHPPSPPSPPCSSLLARQTAARLRTRLTLGQGEEYFTPAVVSVDTSGRRENTNGSIRWLARSCRVTS